MKKFLTVFLLAIMVLALAACSEDKGDSGSKSEGSSKGEVKTIRAGLGLNDLHPQYKGLLKFKEIVEEKQTDKLSLKLTIVDNSVMTVQ